MLSDKTDFKSNPVRDQKRALYNDKGVNSSSDDNNHKYICPNTGHLNIVSKY